MSPIRVLIVDDEPLVCRHLAAILSAAPAERQTVLFSATMPVRVDKIARRHLRNPVRILIAREAAPAGEAPKVRQSAYVVARAHKPVALGRVLDVESPEAVLSVGDAVRVKVIDVDVSRRRVSLSMRQVGGQVAPVTEREIEEERPEASEASGDGSEPIASVPAEPAPEASEPSAPAVAQPFQAGAVGGGVLARQVAHVKAEDLDPHGVGVEAVVGLGHEDRLELAAHGLAPVALRQPS